MQPFHHFLSNVEKKKKVCIDLESVWQRGGVHVSCDLKLQAVW